MNDSIFNPFYERFADKLGLQVAGKVLLSLFSGLLFFIPYFARVGQKSLHDWSWLLGSLIACGVLFLYFATATLRGLFPLWQLHVGEVNSKIYLQPLTTILSDRRFLVAGVVFGTINLVMGLCFGVAVTDPSGRLLLYFGFFLAGFVCGLPAYGIYGVVATIGAITRTGQFKLDYTAPDCCGGMAFMGDALVKFSLLTLAEGILIATYILKTDWVRVANDWVQLLMWAWIAFPFLLSLLVLIAPAVGINKVLCRYRNLQEQELLIRCRELRLQSEDMQLASEVRAGLRAEYSYLIDERAKIHKMKSWPFSNTSTTSFLGAFLSNLMLAKNLVEKLLP